MNTKLNFKNVISTTLDYYKVNWKNISLYSFYYILASLVAGIASGILAGITFGITIATSNTEKINSISKKFFPTNNIDSRDISTMVTPKLTESEISFLWSQGFVLFAIIIFIILIVTLIIFPFMVNLYDSIIKLTEDKEVKYFSFDKNYIRIFLTTLLNSVIVGVGYIFFIIPGIYLTFRLYPMTIIAIKENLSPVEAMNKAFSLTKGNFWNIVLSAFLPGLIYGILLVTLLSLLEKSGLSSFVQIIISVFAVGFFVLLDINIYKKLINSDQEMITPKPIIEVV